MDEADDDLLEKLIALLQQKRTENWVDLHNLRIIKYGGTLHLDCHLTIPWYFNIHEGHNEVDALDKIVKDNFGNSLELFVHTDGCLDFSCKICSKQNCAQRKSNTVQTVTWIVDNVSSNEKHRVIEN
jgi:divalent metal cation (Fe/Co/Zn/Cd) transporter